MDIYLIFLLISSLLLLNFRFPRQNSQPIMRVSEGIYYFHYGFPLPRYLIKPFHISIKRPPSSSCLCKGFSWSYRIISTVRYVLLFSITILYILYTFLSSEKIRTKTLVWFVTWVDSGIKPYCMDSLRIPISICVLVWIKYVTTFV